MYIYAHLTNNFIYLRMAKGKRSQHHITSHTSSDDKIYFLYYVAYNELVAGVQLNVSPLVSPGDRTTNDSVA